MPWTMTFESLVSQIAMIRPPQPRARRRARPHRPSCPPAATSGFAAPSRIARPASALLPSSRTTSGLVTASPRSLEQRERLDDAVGDLVAGGDAAEDVDEHALHRRVGEHDLQTVGHHRGARAAADVEEVGRLDAAVPLARVRDHVERRHDQAGAVADDADLAVELDVVEVLLLGRPAPAGRPRPGRPAPRGRGAGSRRSRPGSPWRRAGAPGRRPTLASGLTSTRVASSATNACHSLTAIVDDLVGDLGRELRRRRRSRGPSPRRRPSLASIAILATRSGVSAATCSMSMPPATLAMQRKVRFARSSR